MRVSKHAIAALTMAALVLGLLGSALAAEVQFPVTAFTADELAKVREWEKTWAGKKIDKSNVDQIAEFFPPSYVTMFKEPERWAAPPEGFFFTVGPYKTVQPTPGEIEATKKYAPTVKTDDNGVMTNYAEVAGVPFPQPKTGLEIAYNFDFNSHGDTNNYYRNSPNINPRTKADRYGEQEQWEYYFVHRTELDPKPAVPDNPKGYHRGIFLHMFNPPEFINTRYYSLRFIDPSKDDDMYMWYAQFRRIRRMSTAQRSDSVDGTDLIYDDEFFWDGHLNRNTYTLKGTKELLCCRHQDMKLAQRQPGQAFPNNMTLERCKTMIVNADNRDPNYIYGTRVWYIDPETQFIAWTEVYDQLKRFWKCNMMMSNDVKTAKGVTKNFIVGYTLIDFQRVHAGYNIQEVKGVSIDLDPSIFTVSNLQKTY